jgi:hypothetical protein
MGWPIKNRKSLRAAFDAAFAFDEKGNPLKRWEEVARDEPLIFENNGTVLQPSGDTAVL